MNRGQYFTTSKFLKESVSNLIKNKPNVILEPSIGQGDLVEHVQKLNNKIKFHSFEIDKTIPLLNSISSKDVVYGDFLKQKITYMYDTIIANPPYVRTKKGNLYIDFIDKCFDLLNQRGEMIFIVPSDFIKLTCANNIITKMMKYGTFTHFIKPNNESLFKNASIDVIIFRYCRDVGLTNRVQVNNETKFLKNTNGILTFSDREIENLSLISDHFTIHVGMVSGRENVFKNDELGNVKILCDDNITKDYIMLDKFPTDNDKLNKYMNLHKETLSNRNIKTFWRWSALRNYETVNKNLGRECLYVKNMTRSKNVCFKGKVQLFGGNLIIMIPKIDRYVDLNKISEIINSDGFRNNYLYSGRFKIGHKQLSNALISLYENLPNV